MGGLTKSFPLTYVGVIVGLTSLMGLPFTSGFYSKDSIIEMAFAHNSLVGYYGFLCSIFGAFLTAFYCYRFLYYIFFSKTKQPRTNLQNVHESGFYILNVIFILIICTIFAGFYFKQNLASPFYSFFYYNSISLNINNMNLSQSEYFVFFYLSVKLIILFVPLFGFIFSIFFYYFNNFNFFFKIVEKESLDIELKFHNNKNYFGLYHIWHCLQTKGSIDYIYNKYIALKILNFSYDICYINLDRGWLEYFFVKVPTKFAFYISKIINKSFQNINDVVGPSMVFLIFFFFTFTYIF